MHHLSGLQAIDGSFPGCYSGLWGGRGEQIKSINPSTGEIIGTVWTGNRLDYEEIMDHLIAAAPVWGSTPAPKRGEIVRQIGEKLRHNKECLADLISMEMGKILTESRGEIQECIDICDFAVGLSRQLNGNVIPSERADHVLIERYHPLGCIGVITAFNFPVSVYFWNVAISLVCGNCSLWKAASTTPVISLVIIKLIAEVLRFNSIPGAVCSLITGSGKTVGDWMISDPRLKLISFTGSTAIGRHVSSTVSKRFGRCILELGGNNAIVVMPDADLDLALRATFFAAIGTAGQRCTTARRVLLHKSVYNQFRDRLLQAYRNVKIGDPRDPSTIMGPLHTTTGVRDYMEGLHKIKQQGGVILYGGKVLHGNFVEPTIVEISPDAPIVQEELFCPILYLMKIRDLDHAIAVNNQVPQGLSSAIFTRNLQNAMVWMSERGSDCGLVNVNCATAGAEIGGAFGGHKETGMGTEAGSDSWKQYVRRSTAVVNYSNEMPLAQGITFG
jgi:aldehyde dehydrogenase family 7 protein A1